MQFHDVRFAANLSFGSMGGPERRTDIVTLASGFEERNTPWAHSRRRYDAGIGLRSMDDIELLIAFFEARRGQLFGFRWKDWSDFKSCKPSETPGMLDQVIGTGDGSTESYQLIKTYTSGDASYTRPVRKPVAGSVRVAVDGVEYLEGQGFDVDFETGLILFSNPPEAGETLTAGFEFDVPVRFDTDHIHVSAATFQAGEVPDVPVVEVRV